MTKRCKCCGETKPLSEFYRKSRERDGLTIYCKPCCNAKIRRDPEKYRAYMRGYMQRPEVKGRRNWQARMRRQGSV